MANSAVKEIMVEGHKLAALTLNSGRPGTPVILLHGVMSSLNFWTPNLVEPFLPYGEVTSLSLPGHYPAEFQGGFAAQHFTAEWLAQVVAGAVGQLAPGAKVLLVGHSTGGFAALAAAAYFPALAAGLVSVAGFAQGRWGAELRAMQYLSLREKLGRAAFRGFLGLGGMGPLFRATARWHTPLPPGLLSGPEREALVQENLRIFRSFSPEAMRIYFAAMWNLDISAKLGDITAPVLVINGDRDRAVPPAQSALIAATVTRAERVVIRGAGHHPFYERPAEYLAAVRGWLRRQFG